jgi:hypothetical protein
MKYYYEFSQESESGKKMAEFHQACIMAEQKADEWAKKMGAIGFYDNPHYFAGGVTAVMFDKKPSKRRWKEAGKVDGEPIYVLNFPADRKNMSEQEKRNAKLDEERDKLPTVTVEYLYSMLQADIFGDAPADKPKPHVKRLPTATPIYFSYADHWYLGIDYPINQDGFIAIDEKAFNYRKSQLLETIKNKS